MADINVDVSLPNPISVDIVSPTQSVGANVFIQGAQGPQGPQGPSGIPNTGELDLRYYSINNPSGFITGVDLSSYVTKSNGQFIDRPTVNGTGVLLSGEVAALPNTIVYTTGDQTISGNKIFRDSISAEYLSGISGADLRIYGPPNSGDRGSSIVIRGGDGVNGAGTIRLDAGVYYHPTPGIPNSQESLYFNAGSVFFNAVPYPKDWSPRGGMIIYKSGYIFGNNTVPVVQFSTSDVGGVKIFDKLTVTGDSIYTDQNIYISGNPVLTGVNLINDNLTVNGNLNSAGNYYVKVARLTDQTIPNATDTVIRFSGIADPNNWYNSGTYRVTPTVQGNYYVSVMVSWVKGTVAPTNQINVQIRKNGNTFSIHQMPINSGMDFTASLFGITTLNGSSDYIDVSAYTDNTTSQSINGTADGAWTKMELFKLN